MDASSVGSGRDVAREEFAQLAAEVRELSRRIALLEGRSPVVGPYDDSAAPRVQISPDLIPAAGRALLAMAGAYLLRALTELQILPQAAGVWMGVVYAALWLGLAARASSVIATRLYASASMLILAPLLWEASSRLHALPWAAAAAVMALFAIASARKGAAAPVTSVSASAMALVFLVASHDLAVFSFALLAIAASAEIGVTRLRWMTALMADLGVLLFSLVMIRGLPEGYPLISTREAVIAQALLAAIYGAKILGRHSLFSRFEIGQAISAFLIGGCGAYFVTKAALPIGCVLIFVSAACYARAFFAKAPERNQRTFGVFAVTLALTGTGMTFSEPIAIPIWVLLAVLLAFTCAAAFHVPLYLWSAAIVSGAAMNARLRIWDEAGTPLRVEGMVILIGALAAYVLLARSNRLWLAFAAASVCALLALASGTGFVPPALELTLFALALAWTGVRTARRELIWLTYALMSVAGAKILIHDFARGPMALVVSLLGYGIALILLPRLLRPQPRIS